MVSYDFEEAGASVGKTVLILIVMDNGLIPILVGVGFIKDAKS